MQSLLCIFLFRLKFCKDFLSGPYIGLGKWWSDGNFTRRQCPIRCAVAKFVEKFNNSTFRGRKLRCSDSISWGMCENWTQTECYEKASWKINACNNRHITNRNVRYLSLIKVVVPQMKYSFRQLGVAVDTSMKARSARDLKFPQRWCWWFWSSGMLRFAAGLGTSVCS
jgi:hypothetical protein